MWFAFNYQHELPFSENRIINEYNERQRKILHKHETLL